MCTHPTLCGHMIQRCHKKSDPDQPILFSSDADPDPDLWIRICIIKVGSGSVWRDTNPDPDPGHIR